jgi:hypothetical protein
MNGPTTERPGSAARPLAPGVAGISPVAMSKILFFLAAGLSFLLSVYLYFTGDHERGIFVGIWVPSILSAGALLLSGQRHD